MEAGKAGVKLLVPEPSGTVVMRYGTIAGFESLSYDYVRYIYMGTITNVLTTRRRFPAGGFGERKRHPPQRIA